MTAKPNPQRAALVEAMNEAHRFTERALRLLAVGSDRIYPSIERAAAKRASMDLTRALAKFRQS